MAWWVQSVALYASSNNWEEPIAQFDHVGDYEFKLNDIEMHRGTEFKFLLHFNVENGLYVYDSWWGTTLDDVETIKCVKEGTVVWCKGDDRNPATSFLIGHDGKFSFTFDEFGLNQQCFQIEGEFYPAYFLSGEFNNWGEEQFTAWVGSYSLAQNMSGVFEVIDQDYNELGGVTDDPFYLITEENPRVALATEAEGKMHLCLLNEGYYSFTIQNGILTVSNWPVEEITVSIVGSTEPDWNVDWATTIPLTLDEQTGFYVSEETAIPKDFHCRVVKHSSLTSVPDVLYGTSGAFEVLEGGDYFPLTSSEGKDISFTGNGVFTFSVTQDFSALTTTGTYSIVETFFDHNRFKFCDHEANWYGGNTEGGGDTYEIHDGWCTDIPLTMGDLGTNFIIHAADTYKIVLSEGDDGLKLTVSKEAVSITDGISSLAGTDTVGVKFINLAGQVSTKPFAGMNVVVTNRSDGSTTVRKAIRR